MIHMALFTGEVFGPLDWSRRDLAALNIQRGRDHGMPGYNDVRVAYGLPRKESWDAIVDDLPSNVSADFKADLRNASFCVVADLESLCFLFFLLNTFKRRQCKRCSFLGIVRVTD